MISLIRICLALALTIGGIIWAGIELVTGNPGLALLGLLISQFIAALIQPEI